MQNEVIGILHPGNMGIFVAAMLVDNGYPVHWVAKGRSKNSKMRAGKYNLIAYDSLAEFCQSCSVIFSVCPPHAAEDVADSVIKCKFKGTFVDANAISPMRTIKISGKMTSAGITFIDGGIVGGPAWKSGKTHLYLSGNGIEKIASLFAKGNLVADCLSNEIGKASAIKMCYAAWTKGSTALLCAIQAAADDYGVRERLDQQWDEDWPGFSEKAQNRARRVTAKAWRFSGEMEEISSTFQEAGGLGGFHEAAADLYQRLAGFKDASELPQLQDVLNTLKVNPEKESPH
ncbi:MAG: NAD(P)-dependent oxidoreductase [Candidatus Marinimicrobia bacterium]|jgi:3-hydroxyisobutyrate dehydrogenase-like beta-hydroxyacid dehydrogenase|nr:NAD(P)-dependent oxidoreductase [Candidatus Neomarinimicrobiota bacterium]MBT3632939.1 NAD(P)-dependent oxidoreductase [Candidatus Neomarinimicrobiota bacterium]MBT3682049.1 NAD(P)-dependent oxidoreductase [Candidatus Neomarinimicrobiota bacterium]MBT3758922.1 NAD(P)-dependent oxidoreductase [Candidatus Neomarinimicrobiota bacterium]MBT3895179.1 NAD(P)-dependent oxidoreductase [Candidatus Neomarinimicrobiota bacterium]